MAHLEPFPDVTGPELAAASISFVKKLKETHPSLKAIFSDGSPTFLWYEAFKLAARNAPKIGSHLNRANIEGWINRAYRSKDATICVTIVKFEEDEIVTIPQNEHLSILNSVLSASTRAGNRDELIEYVGYMNEGEGWPAIRFRVSFRHASQHLPPVTRLRFSKDALDDSLILVENPASLIIRSIKALFTVELNFSELKHAPYWTTLLIFDLALEAWDIDSKPPLPRLALSHVDFVNILSTRQLRSFTELVGRRLEEIDARLERFHHWDPHLIAREDEQLKVEIARNLFARLLELLSGPGDDRASHSSSHRGQSIPIFPPSQFEAQSRGSFLGWFSR